MIEIKPENYYIGLWHIELPHNTGNWLAVIWRPKAGPSDVWHLDYRFRYYRDNKIHESADERSGYRAKITGATEEVAIAGIEECGTALAQMTGNTLTFWEVRGDGDAFVKKLQHNPPPFMHVKNMSKEEAEKHGYIDHTGKIAGTSGDDSSLGPNTGG